VYVNTIPIDGADPATFRVVGDAYGQDDRHLFYFTEPIDVDAASFQSLGRDYARDSSRVYWQGKPVAGADPATFRVLDPNWECAADATRAYYELSVIPGADPRSFSAWLRRHPLLGDLDNVRGLTRSRPRRARITLSDLRW
jgi:DKNYY family